MNCKIYTWNTLLAASVLFVFITFCAHIVHADQKYEYALFQVKGIDDYSDWPWGVNEAGQVVGGSILIYPRVLHPFVWTEGTSIDLGTFGGYDGEAWDINNSSTVVGWADSPTDIRAFVWSESEGMFDIGTLGGPGAVARGINDGGLIIGNSNLPEGDGVYGFVYDGVEMKVLGSLGDFQISYTDGINESGVIVGNSWSDVLSTLRPVMWKDGQIIDLGSLGDNTNRAEAKDINDLDQVVGFSDNNGHDNMPVIWEKGKIYNLTRGSGYGQGVAYGINNKTQIVGFTSRHRDKFAFLWTPQNRLQILDELVAPRSNVRLYGATDIAENGIIVSKAINKDNEDLSSAYILIPVNPELELSDPIPGIAGQKNVWKVHNVVPFTNVTLAYSLKGGGTVIGDCDKLDAVSQLHKPKIIQTVQADEVGVARFEIYVAPQAADVVKGILFQAASVGECEESQLKLFVFE